MLSFADFMLTGIAVVLTIILAKIIEIQNLLKKGEAKL